MSDIENRFKVRAWLIEEKRMVEVNSLDYNRAQIWTFVDGYLHDYPFHNCILMQCTGLKDKNGQLIFEGDIVHYSSLCYRPFAVKMHPLNTGFYLSRMGYYFSEELVEDFQREFVILDREEGRLLDITVIGNVHENYELLELRYED